MAYVNQPSNSPGCSGRPGSVGASRAAMPAWAGSGNAASAADPSSGAPRTARRAPVRIARENNFCAGCCRTLGGTDRGRSGNARGHGSLLPFSTISTVSVEKRQGRVGFVGDGAAQHPVPALARHRPLRAAVRLSGAHTEHPAPGRPGRAVPTGILRGTGLLGVSATDGTVRQYDGHAGPGSPRVSAPVPRTPHRPGAGNGGLADHGFGSTSSTSRRTPPIWATTGSSMSTAPRCATWHRRPPG